MDMKQKLAGLLDTFNDEASGKEIWGDKLPAESSSISNITLHFDTGNNMIDVYTNEVDQKSRPVFEWEMNS